MERGDHTTCRMKCSLSGDDPEKTIKKLMDEAKDYGFTFHGDTTSGTFEYSKYSVEGEYKRSGKTLSITVKKYPFFATCSMIVKGINDQLGKYLSCKKA